MRRLTVETLNIEKETNSDTGRMFRTVRLFTCRRFAVIVKKRDGSSGFGGCSDRL